MTERAVDLMLDELFETNENYVIKSVLRQFISTHDLCGKKSEMQCIINCLAVIYDV